MVLQRQLRGGLLLLLGFAGLHPQGLLDHAIGKGVEVGDQGALQLQEFRPECVSFTKLRLRRAIRVVRRWPQ
jgi:hypothetical protein